jgi:hypothetical protein
MEKQFCFKFDKDNELLFIKSKEFLDEFFKYVEKNDNVHIEDVSYFNTLFKYILTYDIDDSITLDKRDADTLIGVIDTLATSINNSKPPYTKQEMSVLGSAQRFVENYKSTYINGVHIFSENNT